MNEAGALPTRNFRSGHFDRADEINGDALKSSYFVRDHGCFNCPLRCANIHTVAEGPYAVEATEGPDVLTDRLFEEDLEDAVQGGEKIDRGEFENALARYYQKRGWDPAGKPGEAKQRELGLA